MGRVGTIGEGGKGYESEVLSRKIGRESEVESKGLVLGAAAAGNMDTYSCIRFEAVSSLSFVFSSKWAESSTERGGRKDKKWFDLETEKNNSQVARKD